MSGFSWTLPGPSGSASATGDDSALGRELGRLFGTDIYFRNDFEVTAAGDYLTISGLANLREAIYRRLLTRPGEYKFVPGYGVGLPLYLKRKADSTTIDEIRTAVTEQLLHERRIDSVERVAIEFSDGKLNIGLIIKAAGRALRFKPFTFTEEQ